MDGHNIKRLLAIQLNSFFPNEQRLEDDRPWRRMDIDVSEECLRYMHADPRRNNVDLVPVLGKARKGIKKCPAPSAGYCSITADHEKPFHNREVRSFMVSVSILDTLKC